MEEDKIQAVYSIRVTIRGEADAPTLEAIEEAVAHAVGTLLPAPQVATVRASAERVD